jgi:hypothetical protein
MCDIRKDSFGIPFYRGKPNYCKLYFSIAASKFRSAFEIHPSPPPTSGAVEAFAKVSPSLTGFISSVAVGQMGESLNCKVENSVDAQRHLFEAA